MIGSISSAIQTQAVDPSAVIQKPAPKPASQPASKAPTAVPTDSVKISSAATMLQEATESGAQTAKEAGTGDMQAQRLLAKEAAARK